jgi:GrpB-like predicted nucleotidyltransferase (UPF0157 family)
LSAFGTHSEITRAIEQPVELADYDPAWPGMFEAERERLMDALPGLFIDIAHIGSTAVPGMRAKPLIDMLAGTATMDDAIAINGLLDRIGYTTSPELNKSLKTRQWFMRQSGGVRTHHLHVVVHDGPDWHARINFCRRLQDDPHVRERYVELKEELARRHAHEREAYTEGKSDFILAVNSDKEIE